MMNDPSQQGLGNGSYASASHIQVQPASQPMQPQMQPQMHQPQMQPQMHQPQMQPQMHQPQMQQQPMQQPMMQQQQPMHQQPVHQHPMQQPIMQPQMQQPLQQPMQQPMQPQMQQPMHQQPMQQPMQQPTQQPMPQASGQPWQAGAGSDNGPSFTWDNVPDSDPDEDGPETDDGPTKPDTTFDAIEGYESVAFDSGPSIPPPVYVPPSEDSKPVETYSSADTLSNDAVRAAILAFVDRHCCYGSKPAKEMNFDSIVPSSALHYQLETFTEGRTTRRAHRPYMGGHVDGPHCGRAPLPWQMVCEPSSLFKDHTKILEVPHTSNIKECFRCYGRGFLRCPRCHGRGRVRCGSCGGRGHRRVHRKDGWENRTCHSCHGRGKKRCFRCGGDGRVTCGTCDGYRFLRHFIELVVNYVNHLSDYILETTDMPDELIRDVSGQVLFEQTLPYVWPITQYPVQTINENSVRIVNAHRQAWPQDKLLQQRQVLRSVPVSEVKYTWKDHNKRFWVYGFEHDVHAPDYPHQCCWGCNVL